LNSRSHGNLFFVREKNLMKMIEGNKISGPSYPHLQMRCEKSTKEKKYGKDSEHLGKKIKSCN
jgi:hypothetical protein